ncbi:hypothetical protein HZI73_17715 [Vallitalea pronyensis]|uniref:Uncharacterized protein n=1 Tax=Vallitalea pronyensis TaxID=1348613 RepID=A0A8J8MM62_9FIRM|nr:hypothetical protein [Vallitalea pronyensis]QUI24019.1 hypothetical protein HZI73_17715 [Vallitalea pronyensis]
MKITNEKVKGYFLALIGALSLYVYLFGFQMLIAFTPVVVGAVIVIGLIKLLDV